MIFNKLFLSLLLLFINLIYICQSPQFFNYQAVAHDNNGDILQGKELDVIITILADSANGSNAYEETHNSIITNSYGLFTLKIGGGTINNGSFSNINWKSKSHYLKIQIDAGNGYELLGIHQFGAVPYAKAAERVMYPSLSTLANHTPVDGQFSYFNEAGLQTTVIYGWKTSGTDIYSTISGNMGIGSTSPDSKLDVNGTLTLSNSTSEINTSNTGSANMIPIAYGIVDASGNLGTCSGNIATASWNGIAYEISISGETYNSLDYITQVTIIGGLGLSGAGIDEVFTNSQGGDLIVNIKNTAWSNAQCAFSFVIFKP